MLPRRLLHAAIAQKVWAPFLRGDYDTAVFQAFKDVEVRVREAAELGASDLGVNLMRKAFHASDGALTDPADVPSEKQTVSDLFEGAIGLCRNLPIVPAAPIPDRIHALNQRR